MLRGLEAQISSPSKGHDDGRDEDMMDEAERTDRLFSGDGSTETEGKVCKDALEAGSDLDVSINWSVARITGFIDNLAVLVISRREVVARRHAKGSYCAIR